MSSFCKGSNPELERGEKAGRRSVVEQYKVTNKHWIALFVNRQRSRLGDDDDDVVERVMRVSSTLLA